jgi:hypothetical protein
LEHVFNKEIAALRFTSLANKRSYFFLRSAPKKSEGRLRESPELEHAFNKEIATACHPSILPCYALQINDVLYGDCHVAPQSQLVCLLRQPADSAKAGK